MPYLLQVKTDTETKRQGPFPDVQTAKEFADALGYFDAPFVTLCLIDISAPTFWKDMPHFALSPFNAPGDYVCQIEDGKPYRIVTRTREEALQLAASLRSLEWLEPREIIPSQCEHSHFTMGGTFYDL